MCINIDRNNDIAHMHRKKVRIHFQRSRSGKMAIIRDKTSSVPFISIPYNVIIIVCLDSLNLLLDSRVVCTFFKHHFQLLNTSFHLFSCSYLIITRSRHMQSALMKILLFRNKNNKSGKKVIEWCVKW